MKKLLLIFLPIIGFSQIDKSKLDTLNYYKNNESITSEFFDKTNSYFDKLIAEYPNDTTLVVDKLLYLDSYVDKSLCRNSYVNIFSKDPCNVALEFYDKSKVLINYKRLNYLYFKVYYNKYIRNEDRYALPLAVDYGLAAISSDHLSGSEKSRVKSNVNLIKWDMKGDKLDLKDVIAKYKVSKTSTKIKFKLNQQEKDNYSSSIDLEGKLNFLLRNKKNGTYFIDVKYSIFNNKVDKTDLTIEKYKKSASSLFKY